MSPSNSTRWCPTPEQLMILEEMYKGGVRTPNAPQIQKITAHLSLYGKIEGKNVFYWFQNHKARERQKLRRKLSKQLFQQQMLQEQFHLHHYHHHHPNTFLSFFNNASPPPHPLPLMHRQSLRDPAIYLSEDGADNHQAATTQMKNYSTWKEDPPKKYEMQSCMMRNSSCDDDWVVMNMNVKDAADHHEDCLPCCSHNRPLKTLQLFPINPESSN